MMDRKPHPPTRAGKKNSVIAAEAPPVVYAKAIHQFDFDPLEAVRRKMAPQRSGIMVNDASSVTKTSSSEHAGDPTLASANHFAEREQQMRQKQRAERIRAALRYATWQMHLAGHRAMLQGDGGMVIGAQQSLITLSARKSASASDIANAAKKRKEEPTQITKDDEPRATTEPPTNDTNMKVRDAVVSQSSSPRRSEPKTTPRRPTSASIRSKKGKDSAAALPFSLTTVVKGEHVPAKPGANKVQRPGTAPTVRRTDLFDQLGLEGRLVAETCGLSSPNNSHQHHGLHSTLPLRYLTVRPWDLRSGFLPETDGAHAMASLQETLTPRGPQFPLRAVPLLRRY